jgi:glucoside 3-dehydrogenase (cytochrome c) hitch-hiker subunit
MNPLQHQQSADEDGDRDPELHISDNEAQDRRALVHGGKCPVDGAVSTSHVRVGRIPRPASRLHLPAMERRQVVRFLGAALALPFLPRNAEAAIEAAERVHRRLNDVTFRTLNVDQQALVTNIAEMIIPETDTPGATSVKVPQFIDLILSEWADDGERSAFLAGLADIDARATALGVSQQSQNRVARFVDLTAAQKTELLTALDAARDDKQGAGLAFGRLKGLTVYGYFTSQPVQQKILKTRMFFDGYQGNVPFTPAV